MPNKNIKKKEEEEEEKRRESEKGGGEGGEGKGGERKGLFHPVKLSYSFFQQSRLHTYMCISFPLITKFHSKNLVY